MISHRKVPIDPGESLEEFFRSFPGPVRLEIPGRDRGRCRVLVTLLHGNEPSGLKALRRHLLEGVEPAVTIFCYLLAIEAAALEPLFSHRQVPGKRDFNRCFRPPYDVDGQGAVCERLLQELQSLQPEAVVDMHNTSGEGPPFGVSTSYDRRHDQLVSLFTDRLIVTSLRLGALMECNSETMPVVTVECGGSQSEVADQFAYTGLRRYFLAERLMGEESADYPMDIYYNPLRIEVPSGFSLRYGEAYASDADITLRTDIEHHNFGRVTSATPLGWIEEQAMDRLLAVDAAGNNHFRELYRCENNTLYPRSNQKMFMITSNAQIAISDCLWYVVPDR